MKRENENDLADEIEITPAMIEAGLQFLRDEALPMLTARAESEEFVYNFLKSAIVGGRARK
jgi:hypothetical protein